MNIFVLNAGSSSLKYQVIDTESEHIHAAGQVEGIGTGEGAPTHGDAITQALESIPSGVVISAVGHRVVHGGEKFVEPTVITDDVVANLEKISPLAPLHNPANLKGIAVARAFLRDVPHVAVFDTAFHHTLSPAAFTIPLPGVLSASEGIRKYGFHGTSHQYVSRVASELLGGGLEEHRIITLHLGNGSSVAAIRGGNCIDTSMGFTPTSGLVMGTRSGDLDPGVLTYLLGGEHMNVSQVQEMVTQHSGLLALTGSSDFREITSLAAGGDERALLGLEVWAWRIRHYIGAYAALLGGVDALVFTGGIGENSGEGRLLATQGLEFLGISVDPYLNSRRSVEPRTISPSQSETSVFVISTREEFEIASQTAALLGTSR